MRKFLGILTVGLVTSFLIFQLATLAFAHGGFEKRAGNIVVSVSQDPISPLVGEKVKMYFSFRDESIPVKQSLNEQDLTNWPVTLSVIDTYYGDQSKDKTIFKKDLKTDANGGFSFEYTFNKENYFDIDLRLKDSQGKDQETGFLIQPRKITTSNNFLLYLLFFSLGTMSTMLFIKFAKDFKKGL